MEEISENIYLVRLINDSDCFWWETSLTYDEVKQLIGNEPFVEITENHQTHTINTKVIQSIKDVTLETQRQRKEIEESNERRLKIINEIRSIPLSKFTKFRYGLLRKHPEVLSEHLKMIGVDIDPMMRYNETHLRTILEKCKKKAKQTR